MNNFFINEDDFKFILESNKFEIKKSPIHGKGLFSKYAIPKNSYLGISLLHKSISSGYEKFLGGQYVGEIEWNLVQTNATRYLNHSSSPNLKIFIKNNDKRIIYIKSIKDIKENDEMTIDYTVSILLTENATEPKVIRHYCEVLGYSKQELLSFIYANTKMRNYR